MKLLLRKIYPILIIALCLGLFMRTYQSTARFLYAHDNDLASWIVKDVVIDHHLRLIGQETSAKGIFIGPLFYYLLIPFYLVSHMDPIGSLAYSQIISLASIVSLFYVMYRLYNPKTAGIAALLYAGSYLISQTEREVVPTTSVMLWSIWFFYSVNLIFQGKKSGILIAAILLGLVWHINLALFLLSPIIILGVFLNHQKFHVSDLLKPLIILIIMCIPLFIFETRHSFIQTKSLTNTIFSIFNETHQPMQSLSSKISHVITYASKNATRIFIVPEINLTEGLIPLSLFLLLLLLLFTKKIPGYTGIIFILWMGLYILFFTLHPINLSEYYLNGMNIFWIIILALGLASISPKIITAVILAIFILSNIKSLLISTVNASGYLQKKALVDYIYQDSMLHGYPCVSISYITQPGYNFGYRYFIFLKNLKTAPVISGAPVYSIVFPHSLIDRIDISFGALGLVLPDYSRYDKAGIKASCSGQNSNLTDPMFGFTK